jgi:hypothetical protein
MKSSVEHNIAFNGVRIGSSLQRATVDNTEHAARAAIALAQVEELTDFAIWDDYTCDDVCDHIAQLIDQNDVPQNWGLMLIAKFNIKPPCTTKP